MYRVNKYYNMHLDKQNKLSFKYDQYRLNNENYIEYMERNGTKYESDGLFDIFLDLYSVPIEPHKNIKYLNCSLFDLLSLKKPMYNFIKSNLTLLFYNDFGHQEVNDYVIFDKIINNKSDYYIYEPYQYGKQEKYELFFKLTKMNQDMYIIIANKPIKMNKTK